MSKVIRIDAEVLKELKQKAVKLGIPFSNPDNILRVVLGLKPLKSKRHQPVSK